MEVLGTCAMVLVPFKIGDVVTDWMYFAEVIVKVYVLCKYSHIKTQRKVVSFLLMEKQNHVQEEPHAPLRKQKSAQT